MGFWALNESRVPLLAQARREKNRGKNVEEVEDVDDDVGRLDPAPMPLSDEAEGAVVFEERLRKGFLLEPRLEELAAADGRATLSYTIAMILMYGGCLGGGIG